MKQMKKLASLLLALVMTLALSVSALAAGSNTITVKNAQANETYKIYKMLDLSVNDDKTAYTYTVNADWKDFFTGEGAGAAYVTITNGYVTWKANGDVAAFDTGPFQRGHDFGNEFFPFAQWRLLRDGDAVCRSENRHIAGIGCCAGL